MALQVDEAEMKRIWEETADTARRRALVAMVGDTELARAEFAATPRELQGLLKLLNSFFITAPAVELVIHDLSEATQ